MQNLREEILKQDICPQAIPKGMKIQCVICGKRPRYICKFCMASVYCSERHRDEDRRVLHHALCHHLRKMHTPASQPAMGADSRMILYRMSAEKQIIVDIAIKFAQKSLVENKAKDASYQLRYALHVDKEGTSLCKELKIYILEAEAATMLGKYNEAQLKLCKSKWILTDSDCSPELKILFYKSEGLYLAATQDYTSALTSFANEIIHLADEYGTEHIYTAAGYFHMGRVYQLMGDLPLAYSLYLHTVQIWTAFMNDIFLKRIKFDESRQEHKMISILPFSSAAHHYQLFEDDAVQGRKTLSAILDDTVDNDWDRPAADSGQVLNAMALLEFLSDHYLKAQWYANLVYYNSKIAQSGEPKSTALLILRQCAKKIEKKKSRKFASFEARKPTLGLFIAPESGFG